MGLTKEERKREGFESLLNRGYYDASDLCRPERPKSTLATRASGLDKKLKDEFQKKTDAYRDERLIRRFHFKEDLLDDNGLTDHPKADKAFDIAWDRAHGGSLHDVREYFEEITPLLRD